MSSAPASNRPIPPRKSFAQVAAAANVLIPPKENPTNKPSIVRNVPAATLNANGMPGTVSEKEAKPNLNGVVTRTPAMVKVETKDFKSQQLPVLLQRLQIRHEPVSTTVADLITEKEPDAKSVASRTTITLDEKESLQPDDSASMQAALEEDALSPSGSAVAESRESADPDAKAFREQLNVIDRTGVAGKVPNQTPVALPIPPVHARIGPLVGTEPPLVANSFNHLPLTIVERPCIPLAPFVMPAPLIMPPQFVAPPDEKLLEALASPKDRLFVLKIEQDMIDFVKDPKEEFLQLPQTNSFYRMLSHKLADYYMLGHLVDDSMTSVRIYRTPQSRLPPPLIGPASNGDGNTPPPTASARKIMRRVLERENASSQRAIDGRILDSLNSSQAPSDTGAGSGGDDANDDNSKGKDKTALSREERENRYKEARARIFKDFKEETAEINDVIGGNVEKEISRSSSASGMKKSKRSKKPKDDGFEARSAYSQYGPNTFQANPLASATSDSSFYNPFAPYALGHIQEQHARPQEQPQQNSNPTYSPFGQQDTGSWSSTLQAQDYMVPQPFASPYYNNQGGYDSGNVYGSPMQSFSPLNMADSPTPKVGHPTLSGYQSEYMSPAFGNGVYLNGYEASSMMYNGNGNEAPEQPYMSTSYMFPSTASYDLPGPTSLQYFHGNQHNGFDRQQFNPHSQAFIPSVRTGMVAPSQNVPIPSYMGSMTRPATNSPLQRQAAELLQNPSFSSLQFGQQSPNSLRVNGNGQSPFRVQAQSPRQPQQTSFTSSISKWGNASSLPPKPPPSAVASPFFDPQTQQSLPPNPYAGVTRVPTALDTGAQAAN